MGRGNQEASLSWDSTQASQHKNQAAASPLLVSAVATFSPPNSFRSAVSSVDGSAESLKQFSYTRRTPGSSEVFQPTEQRSLEASPRDPCTGEAAAERALGKKGAIGAEPGSQGGHAQRTTGPSQAMEEGEAPRSSASLAELLLSNTLDNLKHDLGEAGGRDAYCGLFDLSAYVTAKACGSNRGEAQSNDPAMLERHPREERLAETARASRFGRGAAGRAETAKLLEESATGQRGGAPLSDPKEDAEGILDDQLRSETTWSALGTGEVSESVPDLLSSSERLCGATESAGHNGTGTTAAAGGEVPAVPRMTVNAESDDHSQAEAALVFFNASSGEGREKVPLRQSVLFESKTLVMDSPRQQANVPEKQLEQLEKTSIFVLFGKQCTPVSWFSDTPVDDVREMILCACDAIVDTGFILREVLEAQDAGDTALSHDNNGGEKLFQVTLEGALKPLRFYLGRRFEFEDFHQLESGQTYYLQPATERLDLKPLTGDRYRRFKVKIDPLLHVETTKAIQIMKIGSNLLRHIDSGFPHLRQFQLSSDAERLLWYSSDGGTVRTSLAIRDIQEIRLGQTSPTFQAYKLPALEHLSFSIIYGASSAFLDSLWTLLPGLADPSLTLKTLDLTCKDETEFDHWVCGLKALACAKKNLKISKEELLSHSRHFREAMSPAHTAFAGCRVAKQKNQGTGIETCDKSALLGLEECLELPVHSCADLKMKLKRLQNQLARLQVKIKNFNEQYKGALGGLSVLSQDREQLPSCTGLIHGKEARPIPPPFDFGATGLAKSSPRLVENTDVLASTRSSATSGTVPDPEGTLLPHTEVFRDRSELEDDLLEYKRMHELLAFVGCLLAESEKTLYGDENECQRNSLGIAVENETKSQSDKLLLEIDNDFSVSAKKRTDAVGDAKSGCSDKEQKRPSYSNQNSNENAKQPVTKSTKPLDSLSLSPERLKTLKASNQLLWKAEVDIENIEDMLKRLINRRRKSGGLLSALRSGGSASRRTTRGLSHLLGQFNLNEEFQRVGEQISSVVVGLLNLGNESDDGDDLDDIHRRPSPPSSPDLSSLCAAMTATSSLH